MEKSIIHQIGFEVLEDNGDSITLKRVLKKKTAAKNRYNEEMALPKLTVHYFDKDEIQKLQEIEKELIAEFTTYRKVSIYKKVISFILRND